MITEVTFKLQNHRFWLIFEVSVFTQAVSRYLA
jgi:hypothetical protein